jgi:integrase
MPRQPGVWYRQSKRSYYSTIDDRQRCVLSNVPACAASQRKAEARLKQLLRTLTDGPAGPDPSFAFVADQFLQHSQSTNDPETFRVHCLFLLGQVVSHDEDGKPVRDGGFVYHIGKSRKLAKVCEADLDRWLERQTSWNENTKVRARAVVLAAMNYGVRKLNLPPHPLRHVRPGTVTRRERILSDEERQAVRQAVSGCFADYVKALELTGARPFSEIAKVTAADVNLEQGTWTLARWKNSRKQVNRKRVIYLVPEMILLTRKLMLRYPEGPLFRNRSGRPWTRQSLTARFRMLGARLGLEELTAYEVRHGYITDALARGVPAAVVAELCGTSIQTIERHYNHMNVKHDVLRKAAQRALG